MELPQLHQNRECPRMRIQTILNRVEKFKSFVYRSVRLEEQDDGPALVVSVEHRKNNRPVCAGCGEVGPAYDHLEERRFEFVPIWGVLVYLAYRMRRVDCKRCGVTVELVPWCDGKNRLTTTYRWYLATWARRLSWSEVGAIFRTSWDSVCRAVEYAVEWGLAHRDLSEVTALGIDEVAWARGHTYFTLVYDIGGESVSEHSKPASRCEMKSSHFARSEIRSWISATRFGLLETANGECPQDGEDSVDTTVTRGRLVAAADCQRAGDRPRHSGAIPTTATTRPKTSHSARRLRGAKCSHIFAPPGSDGGGIGW
jgi:zinc-finger of transposase IS204/IS1001/IS1096/IS1165